jgi:hypothetical protein
MGAFSIRYKTEQNYTKQSLRALKKFACEDDVLSLLFVGSDCKKNKLTIDLI